MLSPGQAIPPLRVRLVNSETWAIHERSPAALTLVSFRRGAFCRFCRTHIRDLNRLAPEFNQRGVETIVVSVDSEADAASMVVNEGITSPLQVGYGLTDADIDACGLFATRRTKGAESVRFAEPALWLVRPGGTLYATFQSSMSCAPPDLNSLLEGIDILAEQNFPDRGTD